MQRALNLIFPTFCITCDAMVEGDAPLCGACWRETPFISGLVCDACGVPLLGEADAGKVQCDDCMVIARPWHAGRAAMIYRDNARRIVLALKHGDRTELARPVAGWMLAAAAPLLCPGMVVVPVPAHWTRLLRRRYNQAALMAREMARRAGLEFLPDPLVRRRATPVQDGMGRDARFANLAGAIEPHPRRGELLAGRAVLLVDDVMTSGATLAAATEACHSANATQVSIVTLARVAKDA